MKGFICVLLAFLFLSFSSSYCEDIPQTNEEIQSEQIPAGQAEDSRNEIIMGTDGQYVYINDEPIPAGGDTGTTTDAALSAVGDSLQNIKAEAIPGGQNTMDTKEKPLTEGSQPLPEGGASSPDMQAAADAQVLSQTITVSPVTFDLGNISYENTYTFTGAAELQVTSAKDNWILTASGTNFSNGANTIDVSRIKLKASTSSTYETLQTSPVILLSKQKSGTATIWIDYQITLLSADLAGADYLNSVVFSVR